MVRGRSASPLVTLDGQFLKYVQIGVAHRAEEHGKGKEKTIYAMDIGVEVEGTVLYVERRLFLKSPKPKDEISAVLINLSSPGVLTPELVVGRKADTAYSDFQKSLKPGGSRELTDGPRTVSVPDYFITWARHMDAARGLSTQVAMHLAGIDLLTRPKGKDLKPPA